MGDAYGAVGRVDGLPAGTAGSEDVDAEVFLINLDVYLLRLGKHRNGRRRRMDAAA